MTDQVFGDERKFDELCNKVRFCTRCPRMEESARVLSRAAGPLSAPIMFVGEAPGRLGADASEIPFHGDQAGHNFEDLLAFVGLNRSEVFITNAVLCTPRSDTGNNATPNRSEVLNCQGYLREQIDLVRPRIVATLGSVALEALNQIEPHGLALSQHVRTIHAWFGRKLIPLYHPGARAILHRSRANQRSDFQFLADQFRRKGAKQRVPTGRTAAGLASVAREIISRKGVVSYFGLHKLLYLVECAAVAKIGTPLTTALFLRQKDGPYCTDLHLAKLRRALPDLRVTGDPRQPILQVVERGLLGDESPSLSGTAIEIVAEVIASTKALTDAQLKTRAYLTAPMRRLLRIERTMMVNLYNSPIEIEGAIAAVTSGRPVLR